MTNETATTKSGIDPSSFSSTIKPVNDLFRYVNGPWIDTYRLPDDRSRYGSFDKLAEDAENQVREILEDNASPPLNLRPCTAHTSTPKRLRKPVSTRFVTNWTSSTPPSIKPHSPVYSAPSTPPAARTCSAWLYMATQAIRI
ncbi:peptidase M13 [Bifidobacterium imperatoris]|uniref:Peptidase M13 n=1 Tax=Bifidobacterium imperatoris TaxID=2020965 RepID=A0A2N5IQT2_9BIFI|nr:peptidase M13 [Bifidobacterium imperatoris]